MKTAIIAGSTGLIGSELLGMLLSSPRYSHVVALSRKPLSIRSDKLTVIHTDLETIHQHSDQLAGDDVFCCLGTTMAKAGSKNKFYAVDYQYPLELAKFTKANGAKQFLIVTALGADKTSVIFYNRVKGEVEASLRLIAFESLHIFRPSFLLGERKELRVGEKIASGVFKNLDFLIPKKYKPIAGRDVAKAMLHYASVDRKGVFIHLSADLQGL
jgi:uncharacterized protein YbjT (DUF2867 family)